MTSRPACRAVYELSAVVWHILDPGEEGPQPPEGHLVSHIRVRICSMPFVEQIQLLCMHGCPYGPVQGVCWGADLPACCRFAPRAPCWHCLVDSPLNALAAIGTRQCPY